MNAFTFCLFFKCSLMHNEKITDASQGHIDCNNQQPSAHVFGVFTHTQNMQTPHRTPQNSTQNQNHNFFSEISQYYSLKYRNITVDFL